MTGFVATLLLLALAAVVVGLAIAFVLVPLFKGIGWVIGNFFRAIGWLIAHVFEYVGGTIGDAVRLVGAIVAMIVLLPFAPLNVIIGRWSAAGHFAQSVMRECRVAGACLYRIVLRRPLKLFWLHGILEGVEQRLPEAMAAAPGSDRPSRRAGQFDGYRIVGSLPGGGSGAKLYIAEPEPGGRGRRAEMPDRVVVKSFMLTEGSSLPQIVRESRALEAAKQLGLVLDHGMDEHRFFYVMPYHDGDHLGVVTRQLHGESAGRGLEGAQLRTALGYVQDLLGTLAVYHRGGLWHKDVKPENVIVNERGAQLVDLGLVTPLRSAMTLTTHGTEYFRDPEMVRQALRGVKVHQVDGAKFDIYAAGAVLYFMLENTFPAHGGLSHFRRKSPEALRWIVRRAMADYGQRYESADTMLRDVQVVAEASDPWAVRPVDLPSMRGGAAPAVSDVAQTPPPLPRSEPRVADATPAPTPAASIPAAGRPRLRVTNWWTGAYEPDAAGAGRGRRTPRPAAGSRRSAAEQVRTARGRARDLQQRARTRRHQAVAERQPTPALVFSLLLFAIIGGAATIGFVRMKNHPTVSVHISPDPIPGPVVAAAEVDDESVSDRPPVLLALDGFDLAAVGARSEIKRVMRQHERDGYHVVLPASEAANTYVVSLLREWDDDRDGAADAMIEGILEAEQLYGLVWVTRDGGDVGDTLVYSERTGAESRRRITTALARASEAEARVDAASPYADDSRLLLINDHPAKSDPRVEAAVHDMLQRRGWSVRVDDDAEAAVRKVLPPGEIDQASISPRLLRLLEELDLGGVVRIDAAPGDGPAHERVRVTRIDQPAPTSARSPQAMAVN